jgi:hypothetical protein
MDGGENHDKHSVSKYYLFMPPNIGLDLTTFFIDLESSVQELLSEESSKIFAIFIFTCVSTLSSIVCFLPSSSLLMDIKVEIKLIYKKYCIPLIDLPVNAVTTLQKF